MAIIKYCWDRDYHCVAYQDTITNLDQISENEAGLDYYYKITGHHKIYSAEEARQLMEQKDENISTCD